MNNMSAERKQKNSNAIISYGIILYSRLDKRKPLFLLYQRRDTFEYMDFLRGIWSTDNHLKTLFSWMTQEEKDRLKNHTFQELWDDLWVDHNSNIYTDKFARAKRKYDIIKSKISRLRKTETNRVVDTILWGFPKGRRDKGESKQACALREFEEETTIPASSVKIQDVPPIWEQFTGSNGIVYKTCYFVAEYQGEPYDPPKKSTPQCIRKETISDEASDVRWVTKDEAHPLITSKRYNILFEVLNYFRELDGKA